MKISFHLAVLSGLIAPVVVASAQVPSTLGERLARGESLTIVAYGTSLTAGNLWPEQMRRALAKRYWGRVRLLNTAGSGMNSDWGAANLDSHVIAHHPDAVFIEFAVNDAVARFHIPVEHAQANLESMIDRIRAASPKTEIVLQITNPVIDRPEGDTGYRPRLPDYFAMVRRVAAAKGTVLIDHEAAWQKVLDEGGPDAYHALVPDGLHPNAEGYAQVAALDNLRALRLPEPEANGAVDVLVYGGTSAAVMAAIEAKQRGHSVLLVSPNAHLGGLTSSGLGWTDLGDARTIGGLSREFYHRVWRHYGRPDAWTWQRRETFGNAGQGTSARDDKSQTMWTFEPHVAEGIFEAMLAENGVRVVRERLDLRDGVLKRGREIVGIRTDQGVHAARTFIDATYEGDLMAKAGVSYVVGREPNAEFGETLNGVQLGHAVKNQLPKGISPYRRPGDPRSGLLPGVNPDPGGPDGSGGAGIQAYGYRMVLTNVPENRIAIERPRGYQEEAYEILFRAIAAGQTTEFFKLDRVPNLKTDSNNSGGISTDLIGGSDGYPEGGYAERARIAAAHRDWQLGLAWTLQHSPRVPEAIRKRYEGWGLARDEFRDNGGWPYGIYVREARRMRGDVVLTETSLRDKSAPVRSIGMGSYKMDSHNVQRVVGPDGSLMNEGDVQQSTNGPYAIDYGAIVPKADQVTNLFVPVCLSATHIAYGSIRMEPVFMILGQSAATAACLSLEGFTTAQAVDYAKLKERLLADDQVLKLP